MTAIDKIGGLGGFEFIAAASAKTSKTYTSIVINTDAVIGTLSIDGVNVLSTKGLSGVTVSAGVYLPTAAGTYITAITLTSGTAIGYFNQ